MASHSKYAGQDGAATGSGNKWPFLRAVSPQRGGQWAVYLTAYCSY